MKKQITVTTQRIEKTTMEVTFPVYRKTDDIDDFGGSWTIHERIDEKMRLVKIQRNERPRHNETEYEITTQDNYGIYQGDDRTLGLGEYACTAEEFNTALEQAIAFVVSLK